MIFLVKKQQPQTLIDRIHTIHAIENFAVSRQSVHPELIRAIATVKQATREMNLSLDCRTVNWVRLFSAAAEIADGKLADQFLRCFSAMAEPPPI